MDTDDNQVIKLFFIQDSGGRVYSGVGGSISRRWEWLMNPHLVLGSGALCILLVQLNLNLACLGRTNQKTAWPRLLGALCKL
ncbi:JM81 [macacine gammaherpesvirus 11]|uniref:JM81 n=2 Tax=macacine gammaherpesvirus 11 TaxID=2560570 RepID=G9JMQ9_9GAMA|nr:JM81 [Macaca fuscata rhadinovirus]AAT00058.1 JM81 [Macaca fuscata rhadinovirus]AEW87606.1 JM81 [Macaca fuscata rhadinovirus]AEW87776.1 JM81 [Macaca fuscata rhadinovirus]